MIAKSLSGMTFESLLAKLTTVSTADLDEQSADLIKSAHTHSPGGRRESHARLRLMLPKKLQQSDTATCISALLSGSETLTTDAQDVSG